MVVRFPLVVKGIRYVFTRNARTNTFKCNNSIVDEDYYMNALKTFKGQ